MLNANDWNLWLGSNETRTVINLLKEKLADVEEEVIDGYVLQQDSADKIAVVYAQRVGAVEGMRTAVQTIVNIVNEAEKDNDDQ